MTAPTLFTLPIKNPTHPAKYTNSLLSAFVEMLRGCNRIIDPFGGTGKIFLLNHWYPDMEIRAIEIEPEWAKMNPRTIVGNALYLPFPSEYFDAVCTSPTYGNRLSDFTMPWLGNSKRFSYVNSLGRKVHPDNSASWLWGDKYRDFHVRAWKEARRVLCAGGVFVLNIKNHIKDGEEQFVTEWHIETLCSFGFRLTDYRKIDTPSIRFGKHYEKRIRYESVIKFQKVQS